MSTQHCRCVLVLKDLIAGDGFSVKNVQIEYLKMRKLGINKDKEEMLGSQKGRIYTYSQQSG